MNVSVDRQPAHQQFRDHVADAGFPCVGAKSALNRNRYRFEAFGALGEAANSQALCEALYGFLAEFPDPGSDPVTFIASFDSCAPSEAAFETAMWDQLHSMKAFDRERFEWDPAVSRDVESPQFSFSIGERALFVVGLHPSASRLSRRTPVDTLVFNLHAQFETLRSNGRYETLQKTIRKRDVALQGSVNPVLARFGESSEALQYSGRANPALTRCPFNHG